MIRIWIESNPRPQLRARITRTLDVEGREQVSTGATTAEQIETVVRSWLDAFAESVETGS